VTDGVGDCTGLLVDRVRQAYEERQPLAIAGSGSKGFLGRECEGQPLSVADHAGVVAYEPTELVLTARAGTTLRQIDAVLRESRQVLGSDPPTFGGRATIGGTLAANLSGPARPWSGSLRDHVLGVRLINGRGEHLGFGGRVMKNVAGYDVSRLMAGSYGVLGVMTEVTVRVHARAEQTTTRSRALDAGEALAAMTRLAAVHRPLAGLAWDGHRLYVRFAGNAPAVGAAAREFGGETAADESFWTSLREQTHGFFSGTAPLWRFSVPPAAEPALPEAEWLFDWGGAERWLRGDYEFARLEDLARKMGGHVSLFRGGDRTRDVQQTLDAVQQRIHRALKASFDPAGILNPGRLYSWL